MKILLLCPFFTGSHKQWATGYAKASEHEVKIMSLSGHHWKWRMHGAAITLGRRFMESDYQPDLILATDMLNLASFMAITRKRTANTPTALYFHENQLTYPWSPQDSDIRHKRDNHYGFINFSSALTADAVFFNSAYHRKAFLSALPEFLNQFPDHNETGCIALLEQKSEVLPLGMDLQRFLAAKPKTLDRPKRAVFLWNHRWEYDKNPEQFFEAMFRLEDRGLDFKLVILGERFKKQPPIFERARAFFDDRILQYGYAESFEEYAYWLWMADLLPVTSYHDFFGGSVVEAMYCNVTPLLPKRLAYPEHIPESVHRAFFYESDREFVDELQRRMIHTRLLRKHDTAQYVEKYDWGQMAKQYDVRFEAMLL